MCLHYRQTLYTVTGDIVPIQVIDSRELREEENLWLKGLSDKLDVVVGRRIAEEIERLGKAGRVQAYLVSVHKVGYFVDRPCIFSPKGYENAVLR